MHLYGFLVPPWSSLVIFLFLGWSFIASCTIFQSWQKGEKMWVLFKILHVRRRNTCLCKGELCFILLGEVFTSFVVLGASFRFLYTGLVTIFTYIVLISNIYIYICVCVWWCVSFSLTSTCVVSFLSLYTCLYMYAIFISVSHMMPWWVLFKCFRKIGCESLTCHELSFCEVFQDFVVGLDLFCNSTSGYKSSDLILLLWFICLLWFCHGLPNGEIVFI